MAPAMAQQNVTANDSISFDDQLLDDVEIVAQKPLIKMDTDKVTYDVTQDPDAKASTILDLLRKVPMVTVDGQDNITVNGSSNFKVYVDGKPNMMFAANPSQIFKAMPATMAKNIEVITNPGAKYDAEGSGGILNITLNHGALGMGTPGAEEVINGFNGNIQASAGNRGFGGGALVTGQQDKFSFSANAFVNKQMMNGTEVLMEQVHEGQVPSTLSVLSTDAKTRIPFVMGNLSMGYEVDSMSTVNATIGYTGFNMKNTGLTINTLRGPLYGDPDGVSGFEYNMNQVMQNKRNGLNLSADYQRFLNKERTSNITFSYYFSSNPSTQENTSLYDHTVSLPATLEYLRQDRFSDKNEYSTEHTAQVDYVTPLAKNHTLSAGAKYTSHRSNSDSELSYDMGNGMEVMDLLGSEYKNGKSIFAGYAEHEGKYGKYSSRLGVRYEHTWQSVEFLKGNGDDFNNDYGNFIPSLSLSYSPVMFASVGFTYNMRISRPGISFLNPYVDRTQNTMLTYGNPDLDVEKSHNMGLVVNMFTPKVMCNLNLRYVYTGNGIEQFSFTDNENIINTTYGNIVKKHNASASLFASYLLHKNTRLFTNSSVSYVDLSSKELDKQTSGWQYTVMAGVQQTLPKDFNLSAFFINNSRTYTLQGKTGGISMLMANLAKSFFKDKLSLSLQAATGLYSGGCFKIETESRGEGFYNHTRIRVPMTSATLSATWKFGNAKVKVREHKSKVQSDVIEHKSDMEQINQMNQ